MADCYSGMKVWQHSDAQASREPFQHPLQRHRLSPGAAEFPCFHPMACKHPRLSSRSNWRLAMVHGCQLRAVGTGRTFVLCLLGRCPDALGTIRGQFCSGWASGCSAGAAAIANVVHRGVVDHRRVVNVVNVGDVHVVHRTVVIQLPYSSMRPGSRYRCSRSHN